MAQIFTGGVPEGHQTLSKLKTSIESFQNYVRAINGRYDIRTGELAGEAESRLKQIVRMLEMILALMDEGVFFHKATEFPWPEGDGFPDDATLALWESKMRSEGLLRKSSQVGDDLQILTEGFYWIAGRTRTVLRALPGLKNVECEGIRNVRNKLLEHADKPDSGILINSFGWGAACGPVVKALRFDHQTELWKDKGLFVNIDELSDGLRRAIDRFLEGSGKV